MLASVAVAVLAAVASVNGRAVKRAAVDDNVILNYALTLEHLEATFYADALKKYSQSDFTKAGLPAFARGRFEQIAAHEAQHVSLLSGALGDKATAACTYSFPYTDPKSFAALAAVIEGGGVSAYLGAAQFITAPAYVTVAASILTTEARHQAWINSAVNKAQPWSGPEDTPLGFSQVFSIVAPFITGCPSSNPTLPVTAFPALTASPANAASGSVTYTFTPGKNSTAAGTDYYATYFYGLEKFVAKLDGSKKASLPDGFSPKGTYYTVITTNSAGNATDDNTIAGPLISIVNFPA